jgi:hypothetical protein
LDISGYAVPLAAMTYFLFEPDAFNTILGWLFRVRHWSVRWIAPFPTDARCAALKSFKFPGLRRSSLKAVRCVSNSLQ